MKESKESPMQESKESRPSTIKACSNKQRTEEFCGFELLLDMNGFTSPRYLRVLSLYLQDGSSRKGGGLGGVMQQGE